MLNISSSQDDSSKLNLVSNYSKIIDTILSLDISTEDENQELKYSFKILIADDYVYSIITPLLKTYMLRQHNICLNINIKDIKERIRDVMAIYLLTPTQENFAYLKQDIASQVYDNYFLNFIDIADTQLYNKFFEEIILCENYSKIYKIILWPINISVFHPQVFSLNLKRPYLFFNSKNISEEKANDYFDKIAHGIISLMFTIKTIPLIKYRNNWHTEEIMKMIQKIFDSLRGKAPEMINTLKRNNTLMILLDRDTDLPIMLHHASSLGSMISDCFGLSRIEKSSSSNERVFQIDPISDYIWNRYLNEPFYKAGEIAINDSKEYQSEVDKIQGTNKPIRDIQQVVDEANKISNSIDNIRDQKLKGNILTNHSNCFNDLIDIAKKRSLGPIFEVENNLLKKRNGITNDIKKKFFDLLKFSQIDLKDLNEIKEDLYRMSLIYLLTNNISDNDMDIISKKLKNYNQPKEAFEYFKGKTKKDSSMSKDKLHQSSSSSNSVFSKSLKLVMDNLGGFMTVDEPSIGAELINSLSMGKEISNFVTYDFIKKDVDKDKNASLNCYNQIIVFYIGGGCLGEFEYIDELLKKSNKNVIYGCDYLYRPTEFLDDLQKLGQMNDE